MNTSLFPDVNVWLALAHKRHSHHDPASAWFASIATDSSVYFCRLTQLSLLRLLTTQGAMNSDLLTMREAWAVFDIFLLNANVTLIADPPGLEERLRIWTRQAESSPKLWADAYLAAFAATGDYDLVTFDKALADRVTRVTLLRSSGSDY